MKVLVFTAWGYTGHCLWNEKREVVRFSESGLPKHVYDRLDGGYCIGSALEKGQWKNPIFEAQVTGCFVVHYDDAGWTILAAWDRTADPRPNACTVFVVKGYWPGKTAYSHIKRAYPTLWARMQLVDEPLDLPG